MICEGDKRIYEMFAANEVEVLLRAQQWIDELEEYGVEYDLHVAG